MKQVRNCSHAVDIPSQVSMHPPITGLEGCTLGGGQEGPQRLGHCGSEKVGAAPQRLKGQCSPGILTETSPTATLLSVDGVGAYDHVSRQAMLEALRDVPTSACGMSVPLPFWTTCT